VISAPVGGSGKTLLANLIANIFNPQTAIWMAPINPGAEAEWRKIITTILFNMKSHVFFDHVTGNLNSSNLALAITTQLWSDRLLGGNTHVTLENRATWVITGNNLTLGKDIVRLTLEIRLDPQCECPENRSHFKHAHISDWAKKHRAELVSAALILVKNWIAQKRPIGGQVWGSFEKWSEVIPGICQAAGIAGCT